MTFSIGDTIGGYRILSDLGRGGMGQVFQVEHTLTRRLEAMKVLEGGRPDAPEQAAGSLHEIQVQARLDHPNIAAVHHAFWAGEDLILVMELIEGCSLRALVERGRLPLATAIDYACQALLALSYAHVQGVIHRDVSPSNMMVSRKGVLKLTDFGLSKDLSNLQPSRSGAPVGSLYYMPPEQVRGIGPANAQSDLYSLGAVLYELATGNRPFTGESPYSIMLAQVEEVPVAPIKVVPDLPPVLSRAILRALEKNPADRFSSAEEFRQALMQVEGAGRVNRAITSPAAHPFTRRSLALWGTAASALFIVGAESLPHRPPPQRANQSAPIVAHRLTGQVLMPPVASDAPPQSAPIRPPQNQAAPPHTFTKTRAQPAVTASSVAGVPAALPHPAIKNSLTPPAKKRPVALLAQSQPVLPEEPPEVQLTDPPRADVKTEFDGARKPVFKSLKTGIAKLWHRMSFKRSSSEDYSSPPQYERP